MLLEAALRPALKVAPPKGRHHLLTFFSGTLVPVLLFLLFWAFFPEHPEWVSQRLDSVLDGFVSYVAFTLGFLLYLIGEHKPGNMKFTVFGVLFIVIGSLKAVASMGENINRDLWLSRMELLIAAVGFLLASSVDFLNRALPKKVVIPIVLTVLVLGGYLFWENPSAMSGNYQFSVLNKEICYLCAGMFLISTFLRLMKLSSDYDQSDVVLFNLCCFYFVFSLAMPMTHVWGPRWWALRGYQFIPYLLAFIFSLDFFRENQKKLFSLTAELSRSNQDLEHFASVASHDLQEPLRTISTQLQFLEMTSAKKLSESEMKSVYFAVDATKRMSELISSLLYYSRIGAAPLQAETINTNEVLEKVLTDLSVLIKESGALVTYSSFPNVKFGRTSMQQLLTNLLTNALKYRSERIPRIEIRSEYSKKGIQFSIQDNGIGFDMGDAEKIFMIFRRLHPRSRFPGCGIGLATCRKIVERYGGRIWAKSSPGVGSTFFFWIPGE